MMKKTVLLLVCTCFVFFFWHVEAVRVSPGQLPSDFLSLLQLTPQQRSPYMKQQIPTLFGDIAAQLKEKMTSAQSQVLFPWSEEYQNVTETSNPRVQTYPWLVVLPASFADAQNAMLTLWNNQELLGQGKGLVRIAGGKHSFEGFSSVSGGIVISTSLLRNISIDTAAKTITFGAGALFEELYGSLNATMGPSWHSESRRAPRTRRRRQR